MPLVTISMYEGKTPDFKKKINDAIHAALVQNFKIQDWDYNQRTQEYVKNDWRVPDGKSDKYTLIEMCVFPGRTKETKKKLYADIVTRLEAIGIPKDHIMILIIEQPMENWGIRGGVPANEVNLGYDTNL
jgi:phenylpyruvate tautomerase PptA (4-oxalocrotonate tautomerase family)